MAAEKDERAARSRERPRSAALVPGDGKMETKMKMMMKLKKLAMVERRGGMSSGAATWPWF